LLAAIQIYFRKDGNNKTCPACSLATTQGWHGLDKKCKQLTSLQLLSYNCIDICFKLLHPD